MSRAVGVIVLLAAALLAGCAAGPDLESEASTAEPSSVSFGDPELAGYCEAASATLAEDEPAAQDPATAIEEFVRANSVLADTSIEGTEILYDGAVVGHVRISEVSAGGYYVETAEWCYPE
jgi:hypothetical protein